MCFYNFRAVSGLLFLATLLASCNEGPQNNFKFNDDSKLIPKINKYGDFGSLWADLDNDGLPDLLFMNHGGMPSVLKQTKQHRFQNKLLTSGIRIDNWQYKQQNDRHGAACGDYDNDGDIDLYFSHGALRGKTLGIKRDELLNNNGNFFFQDIAQTAGVINSQGRARSGRWVDYNNDGWLDLYILNFASDNVLYKNNQDGTFTDVTQASGLMLSSTRAAWFDYDMDGFVDVLLNSNKLMHNNGSGFFEDHSERAGLPELASYSIALGDVDNDGDTDIFLTLKNKPDRLYQNMGGTFQWVKQKNRKWGYKPGDTSSGSNWGDLDNDGDLDLVTARSSGLLAFENKGSMKFVAKPLLADTPLDLSKGGAGPALADYNQDGYLDIALDDLAGHKLLTNQGQGRHWIKLKLEGRKSNRQGFGAKIWAFGELEDQSTLLSFNQYFGHNGALRSQGCSNVHIGLGELKTVDLKILWPSGSTTIARNVKANQSLLLVEGTTSGN